VTGGNFTLSHSLSIIEKIQQEATT